MISAWGTPTALRRRISLKNSAPWRSDRILTATRRHAASRVFAGRFRVWYQDRYDVEIDPESEAIVTIGSKEGLAHLMLATLDHGDTVLVPNPSYPIHIYGAVIAGAQVRSVPLVQGVDFFNELERAIRESYPKPKMMILGFPSNPTAQCVELEFF
ncbi:aminotransferase class I/II-fold pyridoxal phosphate-dependent enzyme [Kluyvera cryocrescens]|uniref:aminotransferase class I/II-fold pyridoxal phosphate-dependent enzyme n=1 Tax=Kluyvera cryocrescens TaxID=580 RepID=UPI0035A37C96